MGTLLDSALKRSANLLCVCIYEPASCLLMPSYHLSKQVTFFIFFPFFQVKCWTGFTLGKFVSTNTLYYEMTDTNPQFVQKFLWLYDLPLLHN